jgi:hypothetical protein
MAKDPFNAEKSILATPQDKAIRIRTVPRIASCLATTEKANPPPASPLVTTGCGGMSFRRNGCPSTSLRTRRVKQSRRIQVLDCHVAALLAMTRGGGFAITKEQLLF